MSAPQILLTGTGTVGRELLRALLTTTDQRVAILIRGRARRSAASRATALFESLGLGPAERARIDVLRGDITAPGLGLDGITQARLAESIETIIHTAASTSLAADREQCDRVNRGGTANALILAERCYSTGRLQRFVHFSTAPISGAALRSPIREDELPVAHAHANHYEWSKYEGERIVRAAMHAGLPVTILRPSMVVADGGSGRARDLTLVFPVMRVVASGGLSTFPADPAARIHLTPLEFVVEAAVRALRTTWTIGRTFHLTTPNPPTVAQVFESQAFAAAGLPRPRLCPPAEFDPAECGARERELLESVAYCFPYFNSHRSFELKNTRRLLPLPVADTALLNRLARHAHAGPDLRRQAG